MSKTLLRLNYLKITLLLIAAIITLMSCQSDEEESQESNYTLTSVSGIEINMNGLWLSGCVEANNGQILNESLNFNNEKLEIEIKSFDNLQCNGIPALNEIISITYRKSGTITVNLNGKSLIANTIDGTATYMNGSVEDFKQLFYVDDSRDEIFLHHALFENDGGQINENGYPIELIPIAITKK